MSDIIESVKQLAGPQRAITFEAVAKACLQFKPKRIVETGCYRGIQGDGMSTLILANIGLSVGGSTWSVDIYQGAVDKARELTAGLPVGIVCDDSVNFLRGFQAPIDVLYLDSYDYEEANPLPCQAHQLLEAAAALPKMAEKAIILLDDCSLPGGGKARLADILIMAMGWKRWQPQAQLYQNLYYRGITL